MLYSARTACRCLQALSIRQTKSKPSHCRIVGRLIGVDNVPVFSDLQPPTGAYRLTNKADRIQALSLPCCGEALFFSISLSPGIPISPILLLSSSIPISLILLLNFCFSYPCGIPAPAPRLLLGASPRGGFPALRRFSPRFSHLRGFPAPALRRAPGSARLGFARSAVSMPFAPAPRPSRPHHGLRASPAFPIYSRPVLSARSGFCESHSVAHVSATGIQSKFPGLTWRIPTWRPMSLPLVPDFRLLLPRLT
nr:uncharacterized protein LOC127491732 [Oryctolagus cuniculus]